jgi:hypothetical protein
MVFKQNFPSDLNDAIDKRKKTWQFLKTRCNIKTRHFNNYQVDR